jgi:hypothetical protein
VNESVTQQGGENAVNISGAETTSQLMDARCQEDKLFTNMRNDIRYVISRSYSSAVRYSRYFQPFVCLLNGNITREDVEKLEAYFRAVTEEQKRIADKKEKERSENMGRPPKEEPKELDEEGREKKVEKVDEKEQERRRMQQEKERERTWSILKEGQGDENARIQSIDSSLLQFIPSPPWFKDQLLRYNAQLKDVNALDPTFNIGPFQMNTDTFKQSITPIIQSSVDLIRRLLPLESGILRSNLYDEMRYAHLTLSSRPDSVEEYASVLAFLTIAQGEHDSINLRFENIMALYGVMKSYSIDLSSSDQVNLSLFEKCNSQLRNSIIQAETQKEERIIHFSNNLLERVKDIHKDIAYIRNKINDPSLLVLIPNANDEYYDKMRIQCEELQKEVQKINDEVNKNILYQGLFNVKEDKYEDLAQAKNESDCRTLLW